MAKRTVRRYSDDRLVWSDMAIHKAGIDPFTGWVYVYLAGRADTNGRAWPKQDTIATDCGMSKRQVARCIDRLVELKLVVTMTNNIAGGGRRTIFFLTTKNEWLSGQVQNACEALCEGLEMPVSQPQNACEAFQHIKGTHTNELIPNRVPEAPQKSTKGKKAPDPKSFLAMFFPDEFRHDDDFVAAWDGWGQNRIEAKNPLNERAAKIAANKLVSFPIKIAIEALERSTMNGWTGVFPESVAKGPQAGKFQDASAAQPKQDFGF